MVFLLFLPHFLEAPKSEGFCSQGERLHSGRETSGFKGGTGKAEAAKLPGAGTNPKPCPRKCVEEKGQVPDSVKSLGGEDDVKRDRLRTLRSRAVSDRARWMFERPDVEVRRTPYERVLDLEWKYVLCFLA
jgi:hypothetical protein